jgi:hypothetical protein
MEDVPTESVKEIEIAPVKSEPIQYDQEGYPLIRVDFTIEMPLELIKDTMYHLIAFADWWSLNRVCKRLHTLCKSEFRDRKAIASYEDENSENNVSKTVTILPCGRCCLKKYHVTSGFPDRLSCHIHINYKENKFDGIARYYAENGVLMKQAYYVNGVMDGLFEEWDDSATKRESKSPLMRICFDYGKTIGFVYKRDKRDRGVDILCEMIDTPSKKFSESGYLTTNGKCIVTNQSNDTRIECNFVMGLLDGDMTITVGNDFVCNVTYEKGIRKKTIYTEIGEKRSDINHIELHIRFDVDELSRFIHRGKINFSEHLISHTATKEINEWLQQMILFRYSNPYYYGDPQFMKGVYRAFSFNKQTAIYKSLIDGNTDPDYDENYYHSSRILSRLKSKRKQSPNESMVILKPPRTQ